MPQRKTGELSMPELTRQFEGQNELARTTGSGEYTGGEKTLLSTSVRKRGSLQRQMLNGEPVTNLRAGQPIASK